MPDSPLRLEDPDFLDGVRLEITPSDLPGIRVSLAAARRLRSVHVDTFESEAIRTAAFEIGFTRDVPNVNDEQLAHLDERGFVRIGSRVGPGDLLVGRSRSEPRRFGLSEEEKLLRQIFGESSGARDASMRVPPGVKGTVTAVRLGPVESPGSPGPSPGKNRQTVEIELTDRRDLAIGDILATDDGHRGVVTAIADGPADLRWGAIDGPRHVSKVGCAEDVQMARSIGPYSLVTQQPLGGRRSFGGQSVGPAELSALEARGAWWCARELLTLKSDDVTGRIRAYESIVKGEEEMASGTPEGVWVLRRELTALGFGVEDLDDTPVSAPSPGPFGSLFPRVVSPTAAWGLRLADTAYVRSESCGEVKKPETLNYLTFEAAVDGLFCARIFGPLRDYECSCGKYGQMKDRGLVCEVCGVEVIQSSVRRQRFGHLELARPLLHPLALAEVATLLGRPAREIREVLYSRTRLDGSPADDWQTTGAGVLRDALGALDLRRLEAAGGARGALAATFLAHGTSPADLVFEAWPVLPPDLRPLVPLDDGRFATSDLNDHYRRLVNRSNRTRRLLELNAPAIIILNEQAMMQIALDDLVQNGIRHRKQTGPNRRPLRSLLDLMPGPAGRFAGQLARRRVDYSASGRVVLDPTLARGVLRMPRSMAEELFRPWIYCALERAGFVTTIRAAKKMIEARAPEALTLLEAHVAEHPVVAFPGSGGTATTTVGSFRVVLWDERALALHPDDVRDLQLGWDELLVVHVPVDGRAIREARELLAVRPSPPRGSEVLQSRLRRWIVAERDCGADRRGLDTCRATRGVCVGCAGEPLGTPIGLRAAEALAPLGKPVERAKTLREAVDAGADLFFAGLLFRDVRRGWIGRAARAPGPRGLGQVLVDAALHREVDPVDDPETRSLLGRIGW